jgi:hypothetical protein
MSAAPAPDLDSLRQLLERRFPDATPVTHRTTGQVASGLATLDRILPSGGFPRGRLSVWTPHGGATALLRATCSSVVAAGERSAWIDGAHAVAGHTWQAGPMLLRPKSRLHALRAAEEILRCGGFALVVLAGIDPPARGPEAVRLTRAAREGGSALIGISPQTALASLRITSAIDPQGYQWRPSPFANEHAGVVSATVTVRTRALGWSAKAEFVLPVAHHDLRRTIEPGLIDRRGVHR